MTNISVEDAEEYTQSLGQILGGSWRQIALAERMGVPNALGLSIQEWVKERLGGYTRIGVSERREAVRELTAPPEEGGQGMSQREAADVLGVSHTTVQRDLDPEPGTNVPPEPELMFDDDEDVTDLQEDGGDAEDPEPGTNVPPEPQKPIIHDGDEWYTPRWLFDALGVKFSIDVCAPIDQTYSSVPAEFTFTAVDDGLAQPWHGTVWCNPPYSQPEPWARRMIHHRDGLLLTHIPMNAGWCVDLWDVCDGIRLFQAMEFVRPDGTSQRPGYWLQLAAFGSVATAALERLQPLGGAAYNKRRIASPMWRRA